jgi:hypothetical protein
MNMKPLRFLTASAMAIVFTLGTALPAFAVTKYPLICRGGSGLWLDIYKSHPTWIGSSFIGNSILLGFNHGTTPSYVGLKPGECTWSDRGMGSKEPTRICMDGVGVEVALRNTGTGGWTLAFVDPNTGTADQVVRALSGLIHDSDYQTFWVYNDGTGCMRF